jgi:hypothetical protein
MQSSLLYALSCTRCRCGARSSFLLRILRSGLQRVDLDRIEYSYTFDVMLLLLPGHDLDGFPRVLGPVDGGPREGAQATLKQDYTFVFDARSAEQELVVKLYMEYLWLSEVDRKSFCCRFLSMSSAVTNAPPLLRRRPAASPSPPRIRQPKRAAHLGRPHPPHCARFRTQVHSRRSGDPVAIQTPRGARDGGGGHLLCVRPREGARARRGLAGRARRGRVAETVAGQDGEAGVRACRVSLLSTPSSMSSLARRSRLCRP